MASTFPVSDNNNNDDNGDVDTSRLLSQPISLTNNKEEEEKKDVNNNNNNNVNNSSSPLNPSTMSNISVTTSKFLNHYRRPVKIILSWKSLLMESSHEKLSFAIENLIGCQKNNNSLILHFYQSNHSVCFGNNNNNNNDNDNNDSDHNKTVNKRIHFPVSLLSNNNELLTLWNIYFNRASQSLPIINELLPPRKILLFVNPHSGTGQAVKIAAEIKVLLKYSQIPFEFKTTEYSGHAEKLIQEYDFTSDSKSENNNGNSNNNSNNSICPTSVITISGDGLIYELVNGLMKRSDSFSLLPFLTFGVISSGSGNGLAKSVCFVSKEEYSIINEIYIIIKNYQRPLDLSTIINTEQSQQSNAPLFCFLGLSWAMISDIDLDSEKYRWMGSTRFTVSAIANIMKLQKHSATLELLIENTEENNNSNNKFNPKKNKTLKNIINKENDSCNYSGVCNKCLNGTKKNQEKNETNEIQELKQYLSKFQSTQKTNPSSPMSQSPSNSSSSLSSSDSLLANNYYWKSLSLSEFLVFWSMNIPYAATDMYCAPHSHFSDGFLDLLLIRQSSRLALLSAFINIETGGHVSKECVEYYKIKGLKIIPNNSNCPFSVDGERLNTQPLEMRIWRGILNIHAK